VEIHDGSEVEPAALGGNVSDVRHPHFIRTGGCRP
jgi:hypothetical protein